MHFEPLCSLLIRGRIWFCFTELRIRSQTLWISTYIEELKFANMRFGGRRQNIQADT
jgi:hypothetical protein